ncbi:Cu2+-exporting ATPase [Rhodoferax sp. OV413]|uniref:heavy metal translocating P-type ATPase n=1 Tax=Rhodoferax sp. OV413 TaxID=1855285 RepID=UPI00088B4B19|nr:cation-translocating P-type ATPase [Rhodoferax sp. OV413]SDP74272.1 Cu2+-exporting ATPase [Rhodoferax sp. OV413]
MLATLAPSSLPTRDWLDEPGEWAAFSQPSSDWPAYQESQLLIDGMHCAACALSVEQALRAVPGVRLAEVGAASRRARVVWSATQTRPSQWLAAVAQAGYHAIPALDAGERQRRQVEQRRALWRWLVAGLCMMQVMMYAMPAYVAGPGEMTADMAQLLRWASWVLTLPVLVFSCGPFFANAWRDVLQRRISMDLPAALGMAVTFAVSSAGTFDPDGLLGHEVYFDSLTMFVFFLLTGRWLELRLRDRTAGALEALIGRLPDSVERWDGAAFVRVAVRRLHTGDHIRVLPGEAFPADGTVLQGRTQVDEALLTGESRPLGRAVGDAVLAGSYNLSAPVELHVDQLGASTRFAQIVALMAQAASQKPRLAQLADRVARPFLWGVLLAAALAGVLWWPSGPGHALMVVVAVLVVTCPCALSLATPAALLAAAGSMAKSGVLVRRLQALENLAQVDTVVFDKTGTLTRDGMAVVTTHHRADVSAQRALALAAALARQSLHPVSRAVVAAAQALGLPAEPVEDVEEVVGQGLRSPHYRFGAARFCGVPADPAQQQVHLSDAQGWLATFDLSEDVRPDAVPAIQSLRDAGIRVELLSGDNAAAALRVAAQVGIALARGGCSPQDKLQHLQALQAQGHCAAMVGDGLNDGPVLAGAHVSFAFGQAVPLAQRQADLVVTGDALNVVPQSLLMARRTLRVVRQNLLWAAAYNAVCVPLALAGWLPAWAAGLGMALSSLLVVLNAARLSRG